MKPSTNKLFETVIGIIVIAKEIMNSQKVMNSHSKWFIYLLKMINCSIYNFFNLVIWYSFNFRWLHFFEIAYWLQCFFEKLMNFSNSQIALPSNENVEKPPKQFSVTTYWYVISFSIVIVFTRVKRNKYRRQHSIFSCAKSINRKVTLICSFDFEESENCKVKPWWNFEISWKLVKNIFGEEGDLKKLWRCNKLSFKAVILKKNKYQQN